MVSPSDMSFLPSRVEAAIGTALSLPLQVRGLVTRGNGEESLEPFSDCRKMSLTISTSEPSIFKKISVDTEAGTYVKRIFFRKMNNLTQRKLILSVWRKSLPYCLNAFLWRE